MLQYYGCLNLMSGLTILVIFLILCFVIDSPYLEGVETPTDLVFESGCFSGCFFEHSVFWGSLYKIEGFVVVAGLLFVVFGFCSGVIVWC